MEHQTLEFEYRNWKGVCSIRTVIPDSIWYGQTPYHPEDQWFLKAFDVYKRQYRDFAINDIVGKHRFPISGA